MHDFFYHGIWRMDWGLGNPNKTAALIVTIMIAVWVIAYIRKWGFWIALPFFTGLGIGLIHTFSRGGIIALCLGILPLIYYAPRPWPRDKIIGLALSVWIIIGFSIYFDAQERYEQGLIKEDRSISNRFEIWKVSPKMMVDAPYGWGLGNSGKAYMEWYQTLNHTEEYRTLVNSHLTWLVEFSWPLRFIYVLTWFLILMLCWPNENIRGLCVPFGVWLSFAIAATFSSVAESPWLWIIPLISLIGVMILRLHKGVWPKINFLGIPFFASCAVMLGFFLGGRNDDGIHNIKGGVIVGNSMPEIWIVADNKVMGQNYGHALRQYLSLPGGNWKAIGIVQSAAFLPPVTHKTIVIAGTVSKIEMQQKVILSSANKIILLNPSFFPEEMGLSRDNAPNITVFFGEFSQSPSVRAWRDCSALREIKGFGDFLPHWPELLVLR